MSSANRFHAVLTGATGGIGRAMAFALAERCDSLLLAGRSVQALHDLRMSLQVRFPKLSLSCIAGDLLDPLYLKDLADYARENQVNLLVNNAGINQFGAVKNLDSSAQTRIIETNLLAPMQLTQAMLPTLLEQGGAQVIQVGSIFGYIGYPGNAAYCASKFGLRGYAQALARELANSPVKVKYLAPRATTTAINKGAVDNLNKALGVASDSPEFVASRLIHLIDSPRFDLKLGFPERLFVFLNQLFPRINDNAIQKQLPTIEKHWSTS
ncbi:MAG: SDR family oxidoreductase [Gammaproteobacteria bacterium]|nr:SDR family oxidoreductase [Gammaproteobacteria bacterium]